MADQNKSTFKDKLRAFWQKVKHIAKRVWAYLKVAKMEYIVMLSLFAFDLITKAIINATMEVGQTVTIIPYVLNFHNVHNSNAAFGAGFLKDWFGPLGARIFFCAFAVAASVVFILILIKHRGGSKLFRVALAMLVAGAMGNCIDRWALAYVRDFVELVYFGLTIAGSKSFYVFNIADAELVIGVVLVIIYFIFVYKDKSSEKKHAAAAAAADGSADSAENKDEKTEDTENNNAEAAEADGENADIKESAENTDNADSADGEDSETAEAPSDGGETETELPDENAEIDVGQADEIGGEGEGK